MIKEMRDPGGPVYKCLYTASGECAHLGPYTACTYYARHYKPDDDSHGVFLIGGKRLKVVNYWSAKYPSARLTVAALEDGTFTIQIKRLTDRKMRQVTEYEFRISQETGIVLNVALYELLHAMDVREPHGVQITTTIKNTEEQEEENNG